MKRILPCILMTCAILLFLQEGFAQPEADTNNLYEKEKIKKGWNFGPLPVLGYNTDIGLQFGALLNVFDYGDGSIYPKYNHQFYLEASWTTKGGGIYQFFYDSEKLLKPVRVTANVTYLTELALDFYGFNGYGAVFDPDWIDEDDTAYKSRVFYRHERKFLRIGADFQGKISRQGNWRWLAGFSFMDFKIDSVDIERMNKGKKEENQLPDISGVYNNYVNWDILEEKERDGGMNNILRLGIIYDSRDNEPNPMKGIWSEAVFVFAPSFLGDGDYSFIRLGLTHRQYFTLYKDDLSFVYRIGYMGTIAGKAPFYFLPYMINSYSLTTTVDGLGGSLTLRGILRNRVVGDGVAFANAELRYKFWHFRWIGQNWYTALNGFLDMGMVVQERKNDLTMIPAGVDPSLYFSDADEYPHGSAGAGIRLVMNRNFVIAADFGKAFDYRDGNFGIYVGIGYLF